MNLQLYRYSPITTQENRGKSYANPKKAYQITLCHLPFDDEQEQMVNHYQMKNHQGHPLTDNLHIYIVELSHYKNLLNQDIKKMTAIEQWALFFETAGNEQHQKIFTTLIKSKEEIAMASELLEKISQNTIDRLNAMSREKALYREAWSEMGARRSGLKEGHIQGLEEGKKITQIETAKRFLAMGLSLEQVSKGSNLPMEAVRSLSDEIAKPVKSTN